MANPEGEKALVQLEKDLNEFAGANGVTSPHKLFPCVQAAKSEFPGMITEIEKKVWEVLGDSPRLLQHMYSDELASKNVQQGEETIH